MTNQAFDPKTGHAAARRRFLLASAAAPVVATLPHGTAWASSIYQCVRTSSDQSEGAVLSPTTLDEWVRTPALAASFRTSNPNLTPSSINLWSLDDGRTWLDENGTQVPEANSDPTTCDQSTEYCLRSNNPDPNDPTAPLGTRRVYVLASYIADPDVANATSVVFQGFYPEERPAVQGGDSGNIGLLTSCLCSLNPNAGPTCPG